MEALDLTSELRDEHQGQWIAYSEDENKIYAHAEDLEELLRKLEELKAEGLTVRRILPFNASFAP